MADFNRVVIQPAFSTSSTGAVRLVLHPFQVSRLHIMLNRDGFITDSESLTQWQREMLDALWEGLPGLDKVFVENGQIALYHHEVFSSGELTEVAITIIRPYLETALKLQQLET